MTNKTKPAQETNDHAPEVLYLKYFTSTPNIIDDWGLDVYQFRLYSKLCRWRGSGKPYSTRALAKACEMSVGKTSQARADLVRAGLIALTVFSTPNGDHYHMVLVDIWPQNFEYATVAPDQRAACLESIKRSLHERDSYAGSIAALNGSKQASKRSPHERKRSPHERSKKRESKKIDSAAAQPARSKADLDAMFDSIASLKDLKPGTLEYTSNSSLMGLLRRAILAVDPDITPARFEAFCKDYKAGNKHAPAVRSAATFASAYGDYCKVHPYGEVERPHIGPDGLWYRTNEGRLERRDPITQEWQQVTA